MKTPSIVLILAGLLYSCVFAQNIPLIVNYQGVVTDQLGQPFEGTGEFRFAIIDNSVPQQILWSNDGSFLGQNASNIPTNPVSLTVTQGRYNVGLGDHSITNMVPIPIDVFAEHSTTYLRVWFNEPGQTTELFQPDAQLVSVPYAYTAASVDGAAIKDNSITAAKLQRESVLPEHAGRSSSVKSIFFDFSTGSANQVVYTVPTGKTFVVTDLFLTRSDVGPIWEFRNQNSTNSADLVLEIDARAGLSNFSLSLRGGIPFYQTQVIAIRQPTTGDSRQLTGTITGYQF